MLLTRPQLESLFDRINLPHETKVDLKQPGGGSNALAALTRLQQYTQSFVPFENTALHYSVHRLFELDVPSLYRKIVDDNEGGLCFQITRLFLYVLKSLGYTVYPTAGRINHTVSVNASGADNRPVFGDWAHMVLIVTITGQKYLVDFSFGPNAPVSPVPLVANVVEPDMKPRRRRLVYSNINQNADPDQRYWRLQLSNDPSKDEWFDSYAFKEQEFLMPDYDNIQLGFRHSRVAWFMYKVMAYRVLLDDNGVPAGWYMMWEHVVRKSWHGKVTVVEKGMGEPERVIALKKYFNITVSETGKKAIKGSFGALRAQL